PHPLYAFFFSHAPAPTAISPLSLHDALPISTNNSLGAAGVAFHARLMPMKVLNEGGWGTTADVADGIRWAAEHGAQVINLSLGRSEEHTSELQSLTNLVCRLLLEKKKTDATS